MSETAKKPRRCEALTVPELDRCELPKGHDGPHLITRSASRGATTEVDHG